MLSRTSSWTHPYSQVQTWTPPVKKSIRWTLDDYRLQCPWTAHAHKLFATFICAKNWLKKKAAGAETTRLLLRGASKGRNAVLLRPTWGRQAGRSTLFPSGLEMDLDMEVPRSSLFATPLSLSLHAHPYPRSLFPLQLTPSLHLQAVP